MSADDYLTVLRYNCTKALLYSPIAECIYAEPQIHGSSLHLVCSLAMFCTVMCKTDGVGWVSGGHENFQMPCISWWPCRSLTTLPCAILLESLPSASLCMPILHMAKLCRAGQFVEHEKTFPSYSLQQRSQCLMHADPAPDIL